MSEMLPDDIPFVEVTVTCNHPNCDNRGHPITFTVPQGCKIVCGVCNTVLVEENTEAAPWLA
jgi:hypothetical protein